MASFTFLESYALRETAILRANVCDFLVLLRPLPESSAVKSPCICSAGTREYILYVFCSPSRVAVTSPLLRVRQSSHSLTSSLARSCSFTRRSFVPVRLLSLCHVRNAVGCAHSQQRQRRSAACVCASVLRALAKPQRASDMHCRLRTSENVA